MTSDAQLRSRALLRLVHWRQKRSDNFGDMLFDLIAKADAENQEQLRRSYPFEVEAFLVWRQHGDGVFLQLGDI